jgi:hypothetical protein
LHSFILWFSQPVSVLKFWLIRFNRITSSRNLLNNLIVRPDTNRVKSGLTFFLQMKLSITWLLPARQHQAPHPHIYFDLWFHHPSVSFTLKKMITMYSTLEHRNNFDLTQLNPRVDITLLYCTECSKA